jgi:hypothetical protein
MREMGVCICLRPTGHPVERKRAKARAVVHHNNQWQRTTTIIEHNTLFMVE